MAVVELNYDLNEPAYATLYRERSKLRLVDLCGYEVHNQPHYAAIWEEANGSASRPSWSGHAIRAHDYQQVIHDREVENLQPVRINGYSIGYDTFFAAIWEKSDGPVRVTQHGLLLGALSSHLKQVRQQGSRIVDITCYSSFGTNQDPHCPQVDWVNRFASICEKSDGRDWEVTLTPIEDYQAEFSRQTQLGRWPVRVGGFTCAPPRGFPHCEALGPIEQMIIALWEKQGELAGPVRHGLDINAYVQEQATQANAKCRPVCIGGYSWNLGDFAVQRFNPIWERREAQPVISNLVTKFMRDFAAPGLSMAVAKDGRLAWSAAFGLADKESGTRVTTSSQFRIASVSKPITSAAIMKLTAENRVRLQDFVFGASGQLEELVPSDARAKGIAVEHLLEHSCGGWPRLGDGGDPMFLNYAMSQSELIAWVLANRGLDTDPGTKFAYSNFGYCLLGRIIEKASGQTYQDYVRQNILLPCGIDSMFIAGDTQLDRRPEEVVYYDQNGADPYSIRVSRLDANGGWLATPTDLVRFAVRMDGFPTPPDILPADWLTWMTTPSKVEGANGYAKGWDTTADGAYLHDGDLPGTAAVVARAKDGYCWAALVNTRDIDTDSNRSITTTGLVNLMWDVHDQVDVWPMSQPL
ncbi:serine hydrolase [Streptomyces olivochromogenes]|uniref:serine hydrolase n=1 Tax=Streptomyces olivochromogenes TaxID=1963 RepID=UPI0036DE04F1